MGQSRENMRMIICFKYQSSKIILKKYLVIYFFSI